MGGKWRTKLSQSDRVYGVLREGILDARVLPGEKLASLRQLATDLGAGTSPVHRALTRLETEGYVVRRHGSGTYVLDRSAQLDPLHGAVLCMSASGHVFAEMAALLHKRLHDLGMLASVLDTSHGDASELLRRAVLSPARSLILRGGGGFPFDALQRAELRSKCALAVITWESDLLLDRVHRILVDYAAGNRLLADHLWTAGHRRLLITAPDNMLWAAGLWDGRGVCPPEKNRIGTGLAGLWTSRGGRATQLSCQYERAKGSALNEYELSRILTGHDAPTAVVGLRDVDAWCVHEAIRQLWPGALKRLTFVGDGDTPFSQSSWPPFTTLNWNLDMIADLACGILRDVMAGQTFPKPVVRLIPPRLVVR